MKNRKESEPRQPEADPEASSERDVRGQSRRDFLKGTAVGLLAGTLAGSQLGFAAEAVGGEGAKGASASFQSDWPADVERVWIGPACWSNPLQDWRLAGGRLELVGAGEGRNVHLLTRRLGGGQDPFEMSVRVGSAGRPGQGRAGFEVGISGPIEDYRSDVIHGRGLKAGITSDGHLFLDEGEGRAMQQSTDVQEGVQLRLTAEPAGGTYTLILSAHDPDTGEALGEVQRQDIAPERLEGGLALFADVADAEGADVGWGEPRLWFTDWHVAGGKVEAHEERALGPVLFAQHTLSRGVLKMTAQMPPVGRDEEQTVRLQVEREGSWETVGEEPIHKLARTATFRVAGWEAAQDVPYRLAYRLKTGSGAEEQYFHGTIRREPVDQETLVVGGLSCQTDSGFPHAHVAEGVRYHNPDLLAFTGDQLYESSGGFGVVRSQENVALATLDYLRKWYLHGWAFGELMRDRPAICIPDDHDVYQGNIWGEGGEAVDTYAEHPTGGYFMPAEWVNMVQRTQTSHLPDPFDPTPVERGITVYYTDLLYGRVSFAILEDRKWKSGPEGLVPPSPGRPDHIQDPDVDPAALDVPGAVLLGERQHAFLEAWTSDWRGADVKVVVSQTAFAAVATHHGADMEYLVADLDSNGWPQTPRNEALRLFRKGFAFHLGGDQHLPLILHQGIGAWGDAGYSYCVPAISTGYPRAFLPRRPLEGRVPGMPPNTGRHLDGLANRVTVHAVANPEEGFGEGSVLERLVKKSSGYGIVRLNKRTGEITMEAWPILSDPRLGDREQYLGWPKTVNMLENDGRKAVAYLPTLLVEGVANPMVQVIDEGSGEVVYTLRIGGSEFRPKVFREGHYTVRVGDDEDWRETIEGVQSLSGDAQETRRISL